MLKTTSTTIKTLDMFLIHTERRGEDEMRSGGDKMRRGAEMNHRGGVIAQYFQRNCRRKI
jgi:hypothetical protein